MDFRLTLMVLVLAAVGCQQEAARSTGEPWPAAWSLPEHQFVIDRLIVPTTSEEARAVAFDLDENGYLDNQAANVVVALGGALDWSPQGGMDDQMARGDNVTLFAIYASVLEGSGQANLWTFVGEPQPLTAGPQPGGTFTVDPTFATAGAWLGGSIRGGAGAFGGPSATMWIRLAFLGDVPLELQAARVEFEVSGDRQRLLNGKLSGAIPASQVTWTVLPALAAGFDAEIAASCALDGHGVCACPSGSRVELIQAALDADQDCRLAVDEFRNNNLVKGLLNPDVTLPSGERGLSLGVGFTAVAASFAHPASPALD